MKIMEIFLKEILRWEFLMDLELIKTLVINTKEILSMENLMVMVK